MGASYKISTEEPAGSGVYAISRDKKNSADDPGSHVEITCCSGTDSSSGEYHTDGPWG